MKVLFVSGELIAGDLAYRLKQEGCEVKLFIEDESRKDCFDGMVEKTDDWKKELEWVGKDGLIIFDDVGYGKIQDELRRDGYNVFGGCEEGDRLEKDREFGQEILKLHGVCIETSKNFSDINDALQYLVKHKAKWVVKQNSHQSSLAYVGSMKDGSDVASVLKSYNKYNENDSIRVITLQKKIDGIEVATGRYFNGKDWIGPICINFEHKPLFYKDIGPLTGEMGTLAWYEEDENNRIFKETLAKIKPYLEKINFKGYADINCIATKNRIVPLEATMRFGCPTNHLQSEIQTSFWKDLLLAIAQGENYKLKFKKGYSVVVSIAIPPFPYKAISADYYLKDVDILFKKKLSKKEWDRIHFEEVSLKEEKKKQYYISGSNGYILYITGFGRTPEKARKQVYSLVNKIVIPKMFYRTDIGAKFLETDKKLLKKWGWL
ncbi:MAG: hypothetical protein PHW31_00655 [Candidatus Pacebacteria bacterium]|nr:hypothetical protein [Candidatus Paceibacterota bacterium]